MAFSGSYNPDPRACFPWGIPGAHSVIPSKQSDLSHWPLGLTVSIPGLERALQQYTLEPSEKPFDLKSVPLATAPMAEQRTGESHLYSFQRPSGSGLHWRVCIGQEATKPNQDGWGCAGRRE